MNKTRIPEVTISSIGLSDLFFNYPHTSTEREEILQDAIAFALYCGITPDIDEEGFIDALVEDYFDRL